jgi:oxygen-independent coproporphyrinogen-3 oxidase
MATSSSESSQVDKTIDRLLRSRQVNKVLHGFPSPRLWNVPDPPVRDMLQARADRRSGRAGSERFALYVGTPYCIKTDPGRCGYCLFPVEEFTGSKDLDRYLGYLEVEAALYRDLFAGDAPTTVYFGGGTSNLYKPRQYADLMAMLRSVFPRLAPGADITLEGIPQLFSLDKLQAIRESGMNRISMGAQQLNPELNALSGRKQTPEHVFQAIAWCQEIGLACNVDLIFGWPRQTVATMVEDLTTLIGTGIREITHYELNVGGPTDFALNRAHELPSLEQNLEMYRVSRDLLTAAGFIQLTPYNWRKPADGEAVPVYREGIAEGYASSDAWGWGFAGLSCFARAGDDPGWTYLNARSLAAYTGALDAGMLPVERGFRYAAADFRLCQIYRHLQGLELDLDAYRAAFGIDAREEFAAEWEAFARRGFVELDRSRIRLVGDGVFFAPLVQTVLGMKRIRELSRSLSRSLPVMSNDHFA